MSGADVHAPPSLSTHHGAVRLVFVRHGESEANRLAVFSNRGTGHPLTGLGQEQAVDLARRLEAMDVDRIYSSPLTRAVETAQILQHELGIGFETTDALREFDVGAFEGTSVQAHWREFRDVVEAWMVRGEWDLRVGGGESFRDMERRFRPFVERVAGLPGTSVLVGHGGLYRCMLPRILANVTARWTSDHPLSNVDIVVAIRDRGSLACVSWAGAVIGPDEVL